MHTHRDTHVNRHTQTYIQRYIWRHTRHAAIHIHTQTHTYTDTSTYTYRQTCTQRSILTHSRTPSDTHTHKASMGGDHPVSVKAYLGPRFVADAPSLLPKRPRCSAIALAGPRMARSEAVHVDGAQVDASGDSFSAGVGPCASADRPNRTSAASMPLTCLYTRSL